MGPVAQAASMMCQSALNRPPYRRAEGTPLTGATVSARPGGAGRVCAASRARLIGVSALALRAVLEAPAVVAGLDDLANGG